MDKLLPIFSALADDTRLEIINILTQGRKCACHINEAFNCSQPTISYHMRVLTDAGLVKAQRDGAFVCYELRPGVWDALCVLQKAMDLDMQEKKKED